MDEEVERKKKRRESGRREKKKRRTRLASQSDDALILNFLISSRPLSTASKRSRLCCTNCINPPSPLFQISSSVSPNVRGCRTKDVGSWKRAQLSRASSGIPIHFSSNVAERPHLSFKSPRLSTCNGAEVASELHDPWGREDTIYGRVGFAAMAWITCRLITRHRVRYRTRRYHWRFLGANKNSRNRPCSKHSVFLRLVSLVPISHISNVFPLKY